MKASPRVPNSVEASAFIPNRLGRPCSKQFVNVSFTTVITMGHADGGCQEEISEKLANYAITLVTREWNKYES